MWLLCLAARLLCRARHLAAGLPCCGYTGWVHSLSLASLSQPCTTATPHHLPSSLGVHCTARHTRRGTSSGRSQDRGEISSPSPECGSAGSCGSGVPRSPTPAACTRRRTGALVVAEWLSGICTPSFLLWTGSRIRGPDVVGSRKNLITVSSSLAEPEERAIVCKLALATARAL